MFNFTPLLGAQSSSGAIQSLLEFDGGVKVLVDVGWDDSFSAQQLKQLEHHVPTISLILLSHATKEHLGAFAHCCKHIPLFSRIPVYATHPVIALGRTLLQDLYSSSHLAASIVPHEELTEAAFPLASPVTADVPHILLQPPTPDEIAAYFSAIHPLKYSQPHHPNPSPSSPPLNGLSITAYSAGHSLGGTIWHIQHGLESIVYAVDWNQAREHVVAGAAWLDGPSGGGSEVIEHLRRPTALICSSRGSERVAMPGGRKRRDEVLVNTIRQTILRGGTVLIPCDSTARALELTYVLEKTAKIDASQPEGSVECPLNRTKLVLAGSTCTSAITYARSMLEWMDESMVREFEAANAANDAQERQRGSDRNKQHALKKDQNIVAAPFDFRFVNLVEKQSRFKKILAKPGPKVIVASDASLEWGFARTAFTHLCTDPKNTIIITDRPASPFGGLSVSRTLWDLYTQQVSKVSGGSDNMSQLIQLAQAEIVTKAVTCLPLSTDETELYQQVLARRKQLRDTLQNSTGTSLENANDEGDDGASSLSESSDESDTEHQGKVLNTSAALNHTRHRIAVNDASLGVNILLKGNGRYDLDVRGKRGRDRVFPFVNKRKRIDEYGEVIRPEDYLRAEEKEDPVAGTLAGGTGALNLKRKGREETGTGTKRKWDSDSVDEGRNGDDLTNSKRHKANGFGPNGPTDGQEGGSDEDSDDEVSKDGEPANAPSTGPRKVVLSEQRIPISVSVGFVDFSGRHDKRSLFMLIPLIRPRKLILVGGEKEETASFADDCRKLSSIHSSDRQNSTIVFTPENGVVVDASVETSAWMVKLSEGMVKKLQWQRVRGLGVVALTGCLRLGGETTVADGKGGGNEVVHPAGGKSDVGKQPPSAVPILDLIQSNIRTSAQALLSQSHPISQSVAKSETGSGAVQSRLSRTVGMCATVASSAPPLHIGDLRLAELRRLMHSSGYAAEFKGEGVLLVNGCVIVRKSGPGKVEIENIVCGPADGSSLRSFFEIRRKIYEELAVVNGV